MKTVFQIVLLIIALVLAYFIYDGIANKIEFKKEAQGRREVVQKRLLKVVVAQKEFRNEKGHYAASFNELFHFINTDSLTIIKAEGTVPDSLTEAEAVEKGIVLRDTTKVAASTIFPASFDITQLEEVPFSKGAQFKMKAGVIEKNKTNVNVFEAYTTLQEVYIGLHTNGESVDLSDRIQVGSMDEPITTGNW